MKEFNDVADLGSPSLTAVRGLRNAAAQKDPGHNAAGAKVNGGFIRIREYNHISL
jgi:hypothetical protein